MTQDYIWVGTTCNLKGVLKNGAMKETRTSEAEGNMKVQTGC